MSDPYTIQQAAQRTGRKIGSIHKLAQAGRCGHKLGSRWVFTEADLDTIRATRGPGRPPGTGKRQAVQP